MGQHPRVCTLMAGIFNNRPPKPRYTLLSGTGTGLNYVSNLPYNLSIPVRENLP